MNSGFFEISLKLLIILCLSRSLKFNKLLIAFPPETNLRLSLVVVITFVNSELPLIKSSKESLGFIPNKICALAIPRSASKRSVSFFCNARLKAKLTAIVVLPTPPLPEVIAIVVVIYIPDYRSIYLYLSYIVPKLHF